MRADSFLTQTLEDLQDQQLLRRLKTVSGPQSARVVLDGQEVINFCSNDYLGLAADPRLSQAAAKSFDEAGFGSGASRLVCGNFNEHQALEQKIADFKQAQACVVFSTGYMANVGILSSVCARGDIIFSDKLNHASIIDGIILSRAEFKRYAHRDMNALENELKKASGYRKRLIVTDSVFSMDGDIAPLEDIVDLGKKYNALVMVDDAHGFGVLGPNGRGAAEHFKVEQDIDIHMGTLSKAAGSFGAYCCGSQALIDFLINKARSFIYTTAMPAAVACASAKAIDIMAQEPQRRKYVLQQAARVRSALQAMGFDTLQSQTPIIPVIVKDPATAVMFSEKLLTQGIFVQPIRPPTVGVGTARLRVTLTAGHDEHDIQSLLKALKTIGKELCLI